MFSREPKPSQKTFLVPFVVAVALFMEIFDATVIVTALPSMARTMGESPIHLSLAITSYLLSLALFLPLSGWMADRFGARSVFVSAIVVFVVGSIGCAFSRSLVTLVAARLVQGLGGAMMVPVARYIMLRSVKREDLVQAMAWFTMPALLGPVMAPPLGGLIVTMLDWTWVFWINVPIGVLGIIAVMRYVPNPRQTDIRPMDAMGIILSGVALAGGIAGLETVGRGIVPIWVSLACVVGGVLAGLGYAIHARHTTYPALDFSSMREQTFRLSVIGGTVFRLGVGGLGFVIALQFQETFGMTAFQAGCITFAMALGAFAMKPLAGILLRRFGFRSTLMVNALASAVCIGAAALFHATTPVMVPFIVLFAGGFSRSLEFTALNAIGFVDLSEKEIGPATTLYSMAQQLSLVLGVTVTASLLNASVWALGGLSEAAYIPVYGVLALMAAVSAIFYRPMSADAGAVASGHRPE